MPIITVEEFQKLLPKLNGKKGAALIRRAMHLAAIDRVNDLYDHNAHMPGPDFTTGILKEIGIDPDSIDERVVARYPEIRNLLYERLVKDPTIDLEEISDPALLGTWKFIPESLAAKGIGADMELLFGK